MASVVYVSEPLHTVTDIQTVLNSARNTIEKDAVKPQTLQFLTPASSVKDAQCHIPCISEWFVTLCREYRLTSNPRFTVLSQSDTAHIVQLAVAERNKLNGGAYEAKNEEVIEMLQKIQEEKLSPTECESEVSVVLEFYQTFLKSSNHVDLTDIYQAVSKELEKESDLQKDLAATIICCFGNPLTCLEKKMFQLLCPEGKATDLSLSLQDGSNMSQEDEETQDRSENDYTTAQSFINKTILSYIHLLVNTRSELALSLIFNVPNRDLDHLAFTAVKREAKKKNLPMYQTLTSFVMRLRLGGKGYAPDKTDPLAPHVKGFGLLMGLVQKLQNIVEEDPDLSSACLKVVSVIRNNLSHCSVCRFKKEDLDLVSDAVNKRMMTIIEDNERKAASSPDKPASEGGSLTCRRSLRIFQQLLDWTATMSGDDNSDDFLLESIALNPNSPTRIPSLLSQFRSPVITNESPVKVIKQKRLTNRNNLKRQASQETVLLCGEKVRQKDVGSIPVLPSKTLVSTSADTQEHFSRFNKQSSASKDKENVFPKPNDSENPNKKARLSARSPSVREGGKKPQITKKKAPAKSCRRRLLPQVAGQKQITSFFRL